ncbi:MAG: family 1 glycosylhydrolase [Verrucomicrobiota bacterium]
MENRDQSFLWGVATSAYQSEGGYNGAGEPQTNWASAEAANDAARTGTSAEFWTRYPEDFSRCREMGFNAFRIGLEWSRIQPTHCNEQGPAPVFDFAALDHYAEMIAECRRSGMQPVVTLHHFVHPAWLGKDPWLDPAVLEQFDAYVTTTISTINDALVQKHGQSPIHYYVTINEPNMFVLNTYFGTQFPSGGHYGPQTVNRCYNQLLRAHIRAYNIIHDLYEKRSWPAPAVTLNNFCSDLYWMDKLLPDLLSARERGVARGDVSTYILGKANEFKVAFEEARIPLHKNISYRLGSILKWFINRLWHGRFSAETFAPLLDAIYESPRPRLFDYVGIDYYDPFMEHLFRLPVLWDHEFKNKSLRSWVMNTITSKWWDWRVLPQGLHFFCKYYSEDFGHRPLLIAENGMALRRRPDNRHSHRRDRITRSEFLRLHVREVVRMVNEGIPIIGYLHWSLFDNYEWGSFTPRFGLFSIDYTLGTGRLAEDHMGDRPSETYRMLIREAREKMTGNPGSLLK